MTEFKFIDLFAGIGGFHLALHALGGRCVFASEIDSNARKTYEYNIKKISPEIFDRGMFNDDIRKISPHDLPDFDVLCAGFPCQPFSQAGYKRGFQDTHKSERGNLFFKIVDILEAKRPKAFFLENVRGIVNHDNGKTFKIIKDILEKELGYSFHHKIIHASDYGLPQLRPRAFMIGFRDDRSPSQFIWPAVKPLKLTMSDIWGGQCSREVGFTLRVGGRGSPITDRRNWDSYYVDGEVRRLEVPQARKMQGFPDDFEFPVAPSQAMKQLGNSVAIDAVRECAGSLVAYMGMLEDEKGDKQMGNTKNKGEWTEIYTFLKILREGFLPLAEKNLEKKSDNSGFIIKKVSTLNIEHECYLEGEDFIRVESKITGEKQRINIRHLITPEILAHSAKNITEEKGTFSLPDFDNIQKKLGIAIIKGGISSQKADIILDIEHLKFKKENEAFGIKSYLGSKPTLLNASDNTNFVYQIEGLSLHSIDETIDEINAISTKQKLKDRLSRIVDLGGVLKFSHLESDIMQYNLSAVDSLLPEIMSKMLLEFYLNRNNRLHDNLLSVGERRGFFGMDLNALQIKVKRLLISILLGLFAGKKWDGHYLTNGAIIVRKDGEQVAFHLIDLQNLENYLYENIVFDTPSTTRHRYGSVIRENDGKLYFKLNMQLRF